jgi:hypothetical protein
MRRSDKRNEGVRLCNASDEFFELLELLRFSDILVLKELDLSDLFALSTEEGEEESNLRKAGRFCRNSSETVALSPRVGLGAGVVRSPIGIAWETMRASLLAGVIELDDIPFRMAPKMSSEANSGNGSAALKTWLGLLIFSAMEPACAAIGDNMSSDRLELLSLRFAAVRPGGLFLGLEEEPFV